MKMSEDDYGFYCDLENAKTMEYDTVEYYVVKISTKYEVRRKPSGTVTPEEPEPVPLPLNTPIINDTPCCFDIPSLIPKFEKPVSNPFMCFCENMWSSKEKSPKKIRKNTLYKPLSFLARIPRDIYYSCLVCTVTASCVYLVMTI
jgi:hypothetical protein